MDHTDENMDRLMKAAFREIAREDWESLSEFGTEALDKDRKFRREERRMRALLRSGPGRRREGFLKIRRHAAKASGIVLAFLVSVFAAGMFIQPVRAAFLRYAVRWVDRRIAVSYESEDPVPSAVEEVFLPSWLPEGWTLETNFKTEQLYSHTILDAYGNRMNLDQHVMKPDEETDFFDSAGVTVGSVMLNGRTEAMLLSYADGERILMWTDRYVFVLSWSGRSADEDVLIRIAESMEPIGGREG